MLLTATFDMTTIKGLTYGTSIIGGEIKTAVKLQRYWGLRIRRLLHRHIEYGRGLIQIHTVSVSSVTGSDGQNRP